MPRLLFLGLLLIPSVMLNAQSRNLEIYWIDVEGGAATLIVSPSGESMLVDTGFEVGDRDAKRIYAATQQAGLKKIDYLVISHYHGDHVGGLPALSKMIPIGKFYGRGDEIEQLLRLVRRDTLTLLYGVSGLGKTSLLQAGLFPALRNENYLPVPIRLDFLNYAAEIKERPVVNLNRFAHFKMDLGPLLILRFGDLLLNGRNLLG